MLSILNKFRISLIISLIFLTFSTHYVQATNRICEFVEVDKSNPIYQAQYHYSFINEAIDSVKVKRGLTESKAKGVVGELWARYVIEGGEIPALKGYVSITTMFKNKGCTIQETLRSHADQGIDDIFVVLRSDGWINQNYNPVFHEAKFDGRCDLRLKDTKTLCGQLSFQWINGNLKKVNQRVDATGADICFDEHNEYEIQSCTSCRVEFKNNIEWLASKLKEGEFYRTISLLCADGNLRIYDVYKS